MTADYARVTSQQWRRSAEVVAQFGLRSRALDLRPDPVGLSVGRSLSSVSGFPRVAGRRPHCSSIKSAGPDCIGELQGPPDCMRTNSYRVFEISHKTSIVWTNCIKGICNLSARRSEYTPTLDHVARLLKRLKSQNY